MQRGKSFEMVDQVLFLVAPRGSSALGLRIIISIIIYDYYLDYYLLADSPRWPCLVRILNGLSRQTHYSTERLATRGTPDNFS